MLCGKRQEDRIGKFFELIFFSAWPPFQRGVGEISSAKMPSFL
jgi:hypothetical protein